MLFKSTRKEVQEWAKKKKKKGGADTKTNGEPCHRHQDANDLHIMLIHNFIFFLRVKEEKRVAEAVNLGQPVQQSITRVSFKKPKMEN